MEQTFVYALFSFQYGDSQRCTFITSLKPSEIGQAPHNIGNVQFFIGVSLNDGSRWMDAIDRIYTISELGNAKIKCSNWPTFKQLL